MKSWRTTLFGTIAGIGTGIVGAYLLKPELLAPFPPWLPGLGVLMSSIGVTLLGGNSRDNSKTSEQVGAGQPTSKGSVAGPIALALILGSGAFVGGAMVAGCAATPQQASYRAASITHTTVDQAMSAWGDYVKVNHPSAATEAKVKAAFEKYQASMVALSDANEIWVTATSTSGTNGAAGPPEKVAQAQQFASQALADLLALLTQLGAH